MTIWCNEGLYLLTRLRYVTDTHQMCSMLKEPVTTTEWSEISPLAWYFEVALAWRVWGVQEHWPGLHVQVVCVRKGC